METDEKENDVKRKGGQWVRSEGSGFSPRIDNLDVKSYIRCMCLSVTY